MATHKDSGSFKEIMSLLEKMSSKFDVQLGSITKRLDTIETSHNTDNHSEHKESSPASTKKATPLHMKFGAIKPEVASSISVSTQISISKSHRNANSKSAPSEKILPFLDDNEGRDFDSFEDLYNVIKENFDQKMTLGAALVRCLTAEQVKEILEQISSPTSPQSSHSKASRTSRTSSKASGGGAKSARQPSGWNIIQQISTKLKKTHKDKFEEWSKFCIPEIITSWNDSFGISIDVPKTNALANYVNALHNAVSSAKGDTSENFATLKEMMDKAMASPEELDDFIELCDSIFTADGDEEEAGEAGEAEEEKNDEEEE
jgi:hypothetical protein